MAGEKIKFRVTWTFLVAFAFSQMVWLIVASYFNYRNHPVSFVVDTAYVRWNTDFPAISVCEKSSSDKLYEVAERLYGEKRDINMDLFLKDIAFFDGTCRSCSAHCEKGILECPKDFSEIVRQVRSPCPELIGSCSWNGDPIDCCEHFRQMKTELGPCLVFNSALASTRTNDRTAVKENSTRKRNFFSNRKTGPGVLVFQTKESVKLYLHSPQDVPYTNLPLSERASVDWNEGLILEFQVKETENADGVEALDVSQRRCRFPWEKLEGAILLYDQYSYSTCVVECHAVAQLDTCNCTDHFIPTPAGWNRTCTTEGLSCLTKFQSTFRSLRTNWSKKSGLVCECGTGCEEPEYVIVQKMPIPQSKSLKDPPMVTIRMSALPSERFRRTIVRTRLDLVVSLGGTAGLFLGASILSAAEILYHAVIIAISVWQRPLKKVSPSTAPRRLRKKRKIDISELHSGFYM